MSISIDNYTDNLLGAYTNQSTSADKLEDTLSKDLSASNSDELMDVCKEFEAYFAEQIFKALEKMVPKDEESSSDKTLDYFKDTLIQEYAKNTTEGEGLGLAQMLYESMKREYM